MNWKYDHTMSECKVLIIILNGLKLVAKINEKNNE